MKRFNLVKKLTAATLTATLIVPMAAAPAYAASYSSVYGDTLEGYGDRREYLLDNGDLDPTYNSAGYALADLTGDGFDELIIQQVDGKHYQEYYLYGYNGSEAFFMGEFGCDADWDGMYGYRSGILYRESYKGSVSLALAEWNGYDIAVTTLYDGSYNREDDPPSVESFSGYYDPDRLLDRIPEFVPLDTPISGTTNLVSSAAGDSLSGNHDRFDLSNYAYRTVKTNNSKGALVFQNSPNGSFMNSYQFWNGDSIYVNLTWRQNGYAIAYQDGVYGYVDEDYINWNTSSGSSDRYDLSNYEYRTVKTNNSKGALVFQSAPNGSFMNKYQFWNGDSIYVNTKWRQDGYAIAYQDGVYGYVDEDYINWNTSSNSDDRYDLDNYGYRTVKTNNARGPLVFQKSPNGAFMNNYQFYNGDTIYVNLYWRQDGYAIAYADDAYGYVDVDYINW